MATTKTVVKYRNPPKKKHRRKHGFQLPLAVVGGFTPAAVFLIGSWKAHHSIEAVGKDAAMIMTGYNTWERKWDPGKMAWGLLPILIGVGLHKVAGKLGINRAIAQAGIPIFRI